MSDSNGAAEHPHKKARTSLYPGSKVEQSQVPNEKVPGRSNGQSTNLLRTLLALSWPSPCGQTLQWGKGTSFLNSTKGMGMLKEGARMACMSLKMADPEILQVRQGLVGRGLLRPWVPNRAADPISTRWKKDSTGNKVTHPVSERSILQFVAIKRKDCGEWAISGGMVEPGEKISTTLKREFGEEAMSSLQKSRTETQELKKQLHKLFSQEHFVVYKGYLVDPETHNAWMQTEAVNYPDETGEAMDELPLEAGDDAKKVKWVDVTDQLRLCTRHSQFIQFVAEKRGAHWSEGTCPRCREYRLGVS